MKIDDSLDIDYTKFKLNNGLKCVLYQREEIHSVTIKVIVNIGSLDENDLNNGISHFIEHVVHDGTEDMPTWDKVEDFKTEHSASTNAYTTSDHTQYYGTFPYQYLEQAIYYFSQIVFHPKISEKDVNKEREIIIDELNTYEDDTDYQMFKNIKNSRFINNQTPYSYEVIGTKDVLKNLTTTNLKDFWKKIYKPENCEIYVVGNFDMDKTKKYIQKYFGSLKNDNENKLKRNYKNEFPDYSGHCIKATQKKDLDKYYLNFTFPTLDFKSYDIEERAKTNFLKNMTATPSYFQSVLFKKLRQELGIVYSTYAWWYDLYARAIFGIETSFDKKHLETVLKEYFVAIENIKKGTVAENVFESYRKKILDTQLMQIDKPENALNWISNNEDEIEEHGKGMMISDYLEFVKKLKYEDVVEFSKSIYDWDKLNINIVSKDDTTQVEAEIAEMWDKIRKGKISLI